MCGSHNNNPGFSLPRHFNCMRILVQGRTLKQTSNSYASFLYTQTSLRTIRHTIELVPQHV